MSIETNSVTLLPSVNVSGDNLTPNNASDTTTAFTATLQAQVERLNIPTNDTPKPISPEQTLTMSTVDLKSSATFTNGDNLGITLQTTSTSDLSSAFPTMLTDVLSTPIQEATEMIAAEMAIPQQLTINNSKNTKQASELPITSVANDIELIIDASNEIAPTANVNAATDLTVTDISVESGDTLTAIDTVASRTKPTVSKLVAPRTPPSQASVADQNNDLDAISATLSELLKSSDSTANMEDSPITLSASTAANTKKPEKTLVLEDSLAMMALTMQPQPEAPIPIQTDPNILNQSQPQDAVLNSLMQTGMIQSQTSAPLKTVTPKTETNTAILTGAKAFTDISAPAMSPESSASNVLGSLLPTAEAIAPKSTFPTVLDNLKPSDGSSALDAGLAKSLANLGSELAAFDRPLNNTLKLEVPAMTAHLYSPDFNEELGTKIMWMTSQKMSSAELNLNPPHLGPVSVHINLQQDQASVAFTTHNAGVKEMLEASIPKLREMLQTQNLNLNDVNVSQQSFSGQSQAQSPNFGQNSEGQKRTASGFENAAEPNTPVNEAAEQIEQSRTVVSNGLVSLYA